MKINEIDTPALLINKDLLLKNIQNMQRYADLQNVSLRPHTKTHKMPFIANLQRNEGCKGIAVAKVGEAEVMAENGQNDIFIANEIVGDIKLNRIRKLSAKINISFGIDSVEHVIAIERIFRDSDKKAQVLIEIEVGENRSGIVTDENLYLVLEELKKSKNINLKGFFSHDGNSYSAENLEECKKIFDESQKRTIEIVNIAKVEGFNIETVSIGSTPPLLQGYEIMEGITEIRPGTYALMDASMGATISTLEKCSATVLTTIISKPTDERVVTDVGAKGLTAQRRNSGISSVKGNGILKVMNDVYIQKVYDEHAIIYSKKAHDNFQIGDKVEIIPVHICPVCNLYNEAYFIKDGEVDMVVSILGKGKLQ